MSTVSVIIPTYNRSNTLIRAIKSALKQTLEITEILVCDDGSTDDSKLLVDFLNEAKVKWIDCGRNGRPAIPRNIGIRNSIGDFIAFLDSDDEWLPNKLDIQLSAMKHHSMLASCTNAFKIRNNINTGLYSDFSKEKVGFEDLLHGNQIICSSVVLNKTILDNSNFFPEEKQFKAIEDYVFWLRLSLKSDFLYLKEGLINYTDDNVSSIRSTYKEISQIKEVVYTNLREDMNSGKLKLNPLQYRKFRVHELILKRNGRLRTIDRIKIKWLNR